MPLMALSWHIRKKPPKGRPSEQPPRVSVSARRTIVSGGRNLWSVASMERVSCAGEASQWCLVAERQRCRRPAIHGAPKQQVSCAAGSPTLGAVRPPHLAGVLLHVMLAVFAYWHSSQPGPVCPITTKGRGSRAPPVLRPDSIPCQHGLQQALAGGTPPAVY